MSQKLIVRASLPQSMTLPRKHDLFDIIDAIFYITKTGCQWNMLTNDYPSWRIVCHHSRAWSDRGLFVSIRKKPTHRLQPLQAVGADISTGNK